LNYLSANEITVLCMSLLYQGCIFDIARIGLWFL